MKTATFSTQDSALREHNGETVTVISPLPESEFDREEVGDMFRIRFANGELSDAFSDELTA